MLVQQVCNHRVVQITVTVMHCVCSMSIAIKLSVLLVCPKMLCSGLQQLTLLLACLVCRYS